MKALLFLASFALFFMPSCTAVWSGKGWPDFVIDGEKASELINKKVNKPSFSEPIK